MMPESVVIRYDRCRMELLIPKFFDASPLMNSRKVLKLLAGRTYQNETAFETLDQFFPMWIACLKNNLASKTQEKDEAEQAVRAAESQVACFGTMATKKMKDDLWELRRKAKTAALAVKRAKAALERGNKINDTYIKISR